MAQGLRPQESDLYRERYFAHEGGKLHFVEVPVRAQSTANIHSERSDLSYRLADIPGIEAAGQVDRNINGISNPSAQRPVVDAPSASELFCRERRIP